MPADTKTVQLDLAQIEQRIIGFYAKVDGQRIDDPYKVIAAAMFNVKEEDVTPEQRQAAKSKVYERLYTWQGREFNVASRGRGM